MEISADISTRIMFPDALHEAGQNFSDLQKTMLDATPDCIKVLSIDGKLLTMNKAGCLALNVPEDSEFGMPWLPLLPEDVHQLGAEALRKATAGHVARFPGKSESPSGLMYWDNLLTPLVDASGCVLSILCVSRDVTAKIQLERKLEDALDREKLLSCEMQHRIKNLFSVVSGLVFIAEREAKTNLQGNMKEILLKKLAALSRASNVAYAEKSSPIHDDDQAQIDLGTLVSSVLQPYGDRCVAIGEQASIRRNVMTNLALFLHELATNAVKYGALSTNYGNVTIRWTTGGEMLDLAWIETGGPQISASPDKRGFGSEMVDGIVQFAGGSINRAWRTEGLIVELHLPNSAIR